MSTSSQSFSGSPLVGGDSSRSRPLATSQELVPRKDSVVVADRSVPADWRERLGETELRRRIWHILPGFLPLILWGFPHRDPLSPTLRGIILGVSLSIALFIYFRYRQIARSPEDNHRLQAVAGYGASVIVTILLFPSALELGLAVLAVLSFGDGSATLFGRALGGKPLPWNAEKTWSGLIAGFFLGGIMASIIYFGEAQPGVSVTLALTVGMGMSAAGILAESIPSRINDNIRVGIAAAVMGICLHQLLVGFPSV